MRQVVVTTVFGPIAETLDRTFGTFEKIPEAELHVFVYGDALPQNRLATAQYHLVRHDPEFVSVRRDALFRRWTLPDSLGADYALVVDAGDAVCVRPLPRFSELLRGGSFAGSPEWVRPMRILGQGFTSTYINAGVTFWNLPKSAKIRTEVANRGRTHYRGPFDDQTVLNEVLNTLYFEEMTVLPSQFNWRAYYKRSYISWKSHFRFWPRVDSLDGVYIYHNQHCHALVADEIQGRQPPERAVLPILPKDEHPLSAWTLFWRRLVHRWLHS